MNCYMPLNNAMGKIFNIFNYKHRCKLTWLQCSFWYRHLMHPQNGKAQLKEDNSVGGSANMTYICDV